MILQLAHGNGLGIRPVALKPARLPGSESCSFEQLHRFNLWNFNGSQQNEVGRWLPCQKMAGFAAPARIPLGQGDPDARLHFHTQNLGSRLQQSGTRENFEIGKKRARYSKIISSHHEIVCPIIPWESSQPHVTPEIWTAVNPNWPRKKESEKKYMFQFFGCMKPPIVTASMYQPKPERLLKSQKMLGNSNESRQKRKTTVSSWMPGWFWGPFGSPQS